MKSALVLEKDEVSSARLSRTLRQLGYAPAPVRTPDEALSLAGTINLDVIVTWTDVRPNDRRSLTGELKRAAPEASVVLIEEREDEALPRHSLTRVGADKIVLRPVSIETLQEALKLNVDDSRLRSKYQPLHQERRQPQA